MQLDKIYFITSNEKKAKTLREQLIANNFNIKVEAINLDIIEPQANSVKEVSLAKAKEAFAILKESLVVEDGGFEIEALKGFPGVYTKYILETIGIDGVLKLMENEKNRNCRFVSYTTFIDKHGQIFQFERLGGYGLVANKRSDVFSDFAWSDFWYIFYIPRFKKVLSELSKEELFLNWDDEKEKSSLTIFIEWLKQKHDNKKSEN
jgi:XTP/dITP diphosphohydrolase